MIDTPSLFDLPRARSNDPQTSKAAAARVWSGWAALVVEALAMYGPACDDTICIRLNVDVRSWPSVKTARSRVTHASDPARRLIVDTGQVNESNDQTIWAHRDFRSLVEDVSTGGVL